MSILQGKFNGSMVKKQGQIDKLFIMSWIELFLSFKLVKFGVFFASFFKKKGKNSDFLVKIQGKGSNKSGLSLTH